ncbi:MAG: hypothetical protein JO250_23735 [Armatimonadetes bacterium]|nr:hypothetical protein [Armatimonadota bacterium]
MTLCYYITGHGYGHAIRTAQILKALPPDVPLILRTVVPERLFREEAPGRDFSYRPAEFDCGCLQSDSVTVLPRATLDRYAEIAAANEARLPEEVAFLKREGVRAVVTDIPAFPLRAAREAGLPGFAVANFTWHDIYQEYTETPDDGALLAHMAEEYGAATAAFLTPLSTPTVADPFPRVERVPLVARRGRNIRAALDATLTIQAPPELGAGRAVRHLALLYLGVWGLDMDWAALAAAADWLFLTYDPPALPVPNVVTLDRRRWPYADVSASVDAVVSKPGYGTVTECIANGVPLIYVPRPAFSEYDTLVAGMARWGGGVPIRDTDFRAGSWQDALDAALSAALRPDAYATNGAEVIAARLRAMAEGEGRPGGSPLP